MRELKTALVMLTLVVGYYFWSYAYQQISQSVPPPYAEQVTFFKPLHYRQPKQIIAKSMVEDRTTGQKHYALIAEDKNVICLVDKSVYDQFKIGDKTDCYFNGKDTEQVQ